MTASLSHEGGCPAHADGRNDYFPYGIHSVLSQFSCHVCCPRLTKMQAHNLADFRCHNWSPLPLSSIVYRRHPLGQGSALPKYQQF